MNKRCDIGIIGLAVMGENLALNIENHGFKVSVYNRTFNKVEQFLQNRGKNKNFIGSENIKDFCQSLEKPRTIMMMIQAGEAVDKTIQSLVPFLEQDDIIIDGGNSNFIDTERRVKELQKQGIHFVGCGVSGGELGALKGPSLMPGGSPQAWEKIQPIFEAITAKVGQNQEPCCTWIGNGGAGHFVKTVHNGIEYGDMQIICEGYDLCKRLLFLNNQEIADLFTLWNNGRLNSYLVEITSQILNYKDENNQFVVDFILDVAKQKGTGKWTAITALTEGIPLNFITESVFARNISSQKELRQKLSLLYPKNNNPNNTFEITIEDIEAAIYTAKLISYAQGFELITYKSSVENWGINAAKLAKIWRGGCIIRSSFLDQIAQVYEHTSPYSLLLSDFYQKVLPPAIISLQKVIASAAINGIPLLGMSTALNYYHAICSAQSPANLLQAQRDFFGAHTYERIDHSQGEFFHTNWTGEGGNTISTTYSI